MPPVLPAKELRCPELPEEPKSPQSLHCHQCRRVVGGGASGDEGNQALVSQAGRCSICNMLVCGSCYCDRGVAVIAPDWAKKANPFAVAREKKLGWVCVTCAFRPTREEYERTGQLATEVTCAKPGCNHQLTASHGWSTPWSSDPRTDPRWLWTTFAGPCSRCRKVFCGECYLWRSSTYTWELDAGRERQAKFWVCGACAMEGMKPLPASGPVSSVAENLKRFGQNLTPTSGATFGRN